VRWLGTPSNRYSVRLGEGVLLKVKPANMSALTQSEDEMVDPAEVKLRLENLAPLPPSARPASHQERLAQQISCVRSLERALSQNEHRVVLVEAAWDISPVSNCIGHSYGNWQHTRAHHTTDHPSGHSHTQLCRHCGRPYWRCLTLMRRREMMQRSPPLWRPAMTSHKTKVLSMPGAGVTTSCCSGWFRVCCTTFAG
jgi:hypothetical protein